MRSVLLNLFLLLVISSAGYVGFTWARQQAFLVSGHQFVQEINDTAQMWNTQSSFPKARQWLNEMLYQRRWELLNAWGKQLVDYDKRLSLGTDFVQAIKKFLAVPTDFRDPEKVKFYALELKQLVKRLPKSSLVKQKSLLRLVAPDLEQSRSLVVEHKQLNRKITVRLPQLEAALQGGSTEPDTSTYCSVQKLLTERQTILNQMTDKCGDPGNSDLPVCKEGASYLRRQLEELHKLDQSSIDEIKKRWPGWREPACVP